MTSSFCLNTIWNKSKKKKSAQNKNDEILKKEAPNWKCLMMTIKLDAKETRN